MSPENGSHVTWRELNLALDPVRTDLSELKGDVKALRLASEERSFLGPRGRTLVNGLTLFMGTTLISALVSVLVALFG